MILEARGLMVELGGRDILGPVDLAFSTGEMVALVGPNGAGKTTLVRALAGMVPLRKGEVVVSGVTVGEASRRDIARRIAVVPQARPPVFEFSVLEFVLMGCHARTDRFGFESADDRRDAEAFLADAELSEAAQRSVGTLSAGEYQRALLARTRMTKAPVWLLDEPTANLDPRHELAFLQTLRDQAAAGGTVLAVLHDLRQASRWFDRVLVMQEGTIVEDGTPDAALNEDVLSEVYGVAMRRVSTDDGYFFDTST